MFVFLSNYYPNEELTYYMQFLQILDLAIMPLGIITLKDGLGGIHPEITTPTPGIKGKGFKSSLLCPAERSIIDGIKRNMGISGETREND